MEKLSLIRRHGLLSLGFLAICLLLSRPEVISLDPQGFVTWYPATGLMLALMLGISPWYVLLVCVSNSLASVIFFHQTLNSFSEVAVLFTAGGYAVAAYILRGPLRCDLGLRRQADVMRYLWMTLTAALFGTVISIAAQVADGQVSWKDSWISALWWFSGDGTALLAVAPFFLIHVFPWVRRRILGQPDSPGHSSEDAGPRSVIGKILESLGQAVTILITLFLMFSRHSVPFQLFYLAFIPIIWIAMRQGIRRVATGLLALDFGIVISVHVSPPSPELLTKVGLSMLVISAVGLTVGAVVSERRRLGAELHERTSYLNSLIENNPPWNHCP